MPPFVPFSHYLSYGATDQQTYRELRPKYTGLIVPATVAAYQRGGTGGFVLTLSATADKIPYLLDSRFPLFQQTLSQPKKSHVALAEILGDPSLVVTGSEPLPQDFPNGRLQSIAEQWVRFNGKFGEPDDKAFDKYASRLPDEDVRPEGAQPAEAILAPYFACVSASDPWWERSQRLFEYTQQVAGTTRDVYRVVLADSPDALQEILGTLDGPERVVIWVSGLDEHRASIEKLRAYREAVEQATEDGHELFTLYGGFFSVLLRQSGLCGQSHGVGFSEHRAWRELLQSGAAPARYYVRRLHRYIPQALAQELYLAIPDLVICECPYCKGDQPNALDYHAVMMHSVWCRAEEIDRWSVFDTQDVCQLLGTEWDSFTEQIENATLAPLIKSRAIDNARHLPTWVDALS